MTEYAYALAKADQYQEAIDVLDLLDNPNTPRALNYRGYATRKLGHTEEGIGYYLKSVALDPNYPQVREYLGEAYVIEGKYNLAKKQSSTDGAKLCSKDCEYYEDLAGALTRRTRFIRGTATRAGRLQRASMRLKGMTMCAGAIHAHRAPRPLQAAGLRRGP